VPTRPWDHGVADNKDWVALEQLFDNDTEEAARSAARASEGLASALGGLGRLPFREIALAWLDEVPMRPIEADYEDGVLRPTKPLLLRQGERVAVVVLRRPDPSRWDLKRLASTGAAEDGALAAEGIDAWVDELEREDGD
jgi:predicted DNA-binding antitoxin AbrB/MazE fold protein